MAGGRSVDVSLVVKAKNEGLDVVAKALDSLVQSQSNLGKNSDHVAKVSDSLIKSLDALGNSATKLDGAIKAGASAYDREAAQLAKANEQLAARQARLEQLKTTEAELARIQKEGGTAKKLKDGAFGPELPSLKNTRSEITSQSAKLSSDQKEIERLIGSVAKLRTEYLAAQDAEVSVRAAIKATTEEFDRQTIAANAAAVAAEKKAAADARMARAAAESAEVQARVNRVTGVSRGAATDNGASYAALAAREEEIFLRQAAAAHKAFEARVRQGAEELRREAQATKEFERYVRDLVEELNPAARAQRYLTEQTAALDKAMRSNMITQKQYDAALGLIRQKAEQLGSKSELKLFGLAPYQTQHLMMQFNDVATQIASGTSVTQTLAQQGGQILQLFPKIGDAIVGAFKTPQVLAFLAAFGSLVALTAKAYSEMHKLAVLQGTISASGVGVVGVTAQELRNVSKELDYYYMSAEDALKITKALYNEGFNEDQIKRFGMLAKDMADVLGIDTVDAAKQLEQAYTGNWNALEKLMDTSKAFNAEQRQSIRDQYEQGDAFGATERAFDILKKKMSEGGTASRSEWTVAINNLATAWDKLLISLANNKVITSIVEGFTALAKALNYAASGASIFEKVWTIIKGAAIGGPFGAVAAMASAGDKPQPKPKPTPAPSQAAVDKAWERAIGTTAPGRPNYLTGQQGAFNTGTNAYGFPASGGAPVNLSPAKTAPRATVPGPTTEQAVNAQKLTKEAERQAILAKEITSQADVNAKLAVIRAQEEERIGNSVAKRDRDRIVGITVDRERVKLQRQLAHYQKRDADEAKRKADEVVRAEAAALRGFVARVARVESSNNPNAANQNSSAVGLGQFLKGTWLTLFRRYYADEAKTMTEDQIIALRKNSDLSKAMIEAYARENAEVLKKAGQSVTEANLYLTHLLGPSGALKVIKAASNTALSDLLPAKVINANSSLMRGKTAGDLRAYVGRRFPGDSRSGENGSVDQAIAAGEEAIAAAARERAIAQRDFNDQLDRENEGRARAYDSAKQLEGLQGTALLNKQRELAIADEIYKKTLELRRVLKDDNASLTPEQVASITESVGRTFEPQTTGAVRGELQRKVDELTSLRDTIAGQIEYEYGVGNNGFAKQLEDQLGGINAQLREAIKNYRDFLNVPGRAEALGLSAEALKQINLQLDGAIERAVSYNRILGLTTDSIANTFTSAATNAIDQFSQSIANGKSAFKSLWQAFRSFASDFLRQIAQMIQQQIIFNLVSGLLKGLTAGMGPSTGGSGLSMPGFSNAGDGIFIAARHSGGLVNRSGAYGTALPMAMFANAARYHSGGIAGLKPGEIPTVLMQGEEVLTRDDPRHVMNGGGGSGKPLTIINAFDESDFITKALNTRTGEQAVLNMVRNNPGAFKAAMG